MSQHAPWIVAIAIALIAGWTDWAWRRIPNWLTVPGLALGLGANFMASGWPGLKDSLLGAAVGLLLLLPFVILRSLGAGDWKLMGAIGACTGLHHFLPVLFWTLVVNGIVALGMIVAKKRIMRTVRNLRQLLLSALTLRSPGREMTLDDPDSVKVPFGVAAALAVVTYAVHQLFYS
jgi:prepilin peptidase CpaA